MAPRGRKRDQAQDENGDVPEPRELTQARLVVRAFGKNERDEDVVGVDPPDWERRREINYLYRSANVLVRDRDLERVRALFDGRGDVFGGGINGLTRYSPPPGFNIPDDIPPGSQTLRALAYIDSRLGVGVATPDHVVSICPGGFCPATEPEVVPGHARPEPEVSTERCDGREVRVAVVDVGFSPSPQPWLAGVDGDLENAFDSNGFIVPYAGHGTFIAGVVRCIAPQAEVFVEGLLTQAGATFESELVAQLDQALSKTPDIISLSAGSRSREELSLLGFDVFWEERLSKLKGVVMVAAAGNDGDRGPFWPAAQPGTVSVGALSENGRSRAWFSNYGGWVDVYAPGENQVNAFLEGPYTCHEKPHEGERRDFDGMARWSGTSFATPLVAGLIAARMSATGENGREAADSLLRLARTQAIRGVGAALFPGQACQDLECRPRCGCHDSHPGHHCQHAAHCH
jgi:hypothetical protein